MKSKKYGREILKDTMTLVDTRGTKHRYRRAKSRSEKQARISRLKQLDRDHPRAKPRYKPFPSGGFGSSKAESANGMDEDRRAGKRTLDQL
jgi:hypothetical protein